MCRTYTEIHLQASILVLLLEQVRTLRRAKARLGRRQWGGSPQVYIPTMIHIILL